MHALFNCSGAYPSIATAILSAAVSVTVPAACPNGSIATTSDVLQMFNIMCTANCTYEDAAERLAESLNGAYAGRPGAYEGVTFTYIDVVLLFLISTCLSLFFIVSDYQLFVTI